MLLLVSFQNSCKSHRHDGPVSLLGLGREVHITKTKGGKVHNVTRG